jgi:hypothetical protein
VNVDRDSGTWVEMDNGIKTGEQVPQSAGHTADGIKVQPVPRPPANAAWTCNTPTKRRFTPKINGCFGEFPDTSGSSRNVRFRREGVSRSRSNARSARRRQIGTDIDRQACRSAAHRPARRRRRARRSRHPAGAGGSDRAALRRVNPPGAEARAACRSTRVV